MVVRRGRRRVEKVSDGSKQSFSVMWCGNAVGEMLPPMVVYKSQNIYENWTSGPRGTEFWCTDSGWFDSLSLLKNGFVMFLSQMLTLKVDRAQLFDGR